MEPSSRRNTDVPPLSLPPTVPQVQAAARAALQQVASVIRNPEIAQLVPCVLAAITDPNAKTAACLDVLLETTFVNSVDAPSIALIVPIMLRGAPCAPCNSTET